MLMRILTVLFATFFTTAAIAQKGITLRPKADQKKVEVVYDNRVLTAYCYFDSTEKPVLFPIRTVSGKTVTRGFPIAPRAGERTDHPHHVGLWLNYESVNGLDFWNNSYAIPEERKAHYGSIRHQKIVSSSSGKKDAKLVTLSHWVDHQGKVLLEETTRFVFTVSGNDFIIDRTAELKAVADEVVFKDVKDGFLGVRVHRSLEMPSNQADKYVDANGIETTVPAINNDGVNGMYVNSEGVTGDAVWSTRGPWTYLHGKIEGEPVAIGIIDHKKNPGYPAYWHARGYGLFAANPLGVKVFSKGKEEMNLTLKKGEKKTFIYRVVIRSGTPMDAGSMEALKKQFHQ